ncbi:hypothetical protein J2Y67_004578 [Neobacillus niacini]|nr:hypothetical protein [Neobacillus niacini]
MFSQNVIYHHFKDSHPLWLAGLYFVLKKAFDFYPIKSPHWKKSYVEIYNRLELFHHKCLLNEKTSFRLLQREIGA